MTTDARPRPRYQPVRTEPPPRRQQLLDYIIDVDRKEGRFPSQREICDHMGWQNTSSVRDALSGLVVDGKLRRSRDGTRITFALIPESETEPAEPRPPRHSTDLIRRVLCEHAIGHGYGTIAQFVGLTKNQVAWIIKSRNKKSPAKPKPDGADGRGGRRP